MQQANPNPVDRPSWQLPSGVSRGTWDYVNDLSIATEYDRFHSGHPLLELDRRLIEENIPTSPIREDGTPRLAIDFGCGPGRNLLPLAAIGWRTLGVDLSSEMLVEFQKRAAATGAGSTCGTVKANMVQLDGFRDSIADVVLCMYSSMGMIHGQSHRRSFLKGVARLLTRDGLFFVHVHNRGTWIRDPGGIRRLLSDWVRSKRDSSWELGDRYYLYRGLPTMYLHIYSKRELISDLNSAGLQCVQLFVLDRGSKQVAHMRILESLRAGGYIALCKRV